MANPTYTEYSVSLAGASFIDSNTQFTNNPFPDRLADLQSVLKSGLWNLFNCPIGARGRIFEPEYGSLWYHFIHEWTDETTSAQMRIAMVQAIQRWEPRVTVIMAETFIKRRLDLPGFEVQISLRDNITGLRQSFNFEVVQKT